jgi:hypothetical protein
MLIYVGLVEDNIDPKRLGRLKIRVFGVYDQIPTEDIPWSSPFTSTDGKSFHVPAVGKLMSIVFIKNNLYSPYYLDSENCNINLKDRLDDMDDDNYINFSALLYDHRTQIYSDNDELKIDWYFNNITINDSSINLDLKNNSQKINLGDSTKSTQPALFGDHWLSWFDKLVTNLLNPTSLTGNMGAPIIKSTIDQVLSEYQQIRKTFISNNIFLVDNGDIEENDKNKRKYETKSYTHDIDLKLNKTNIINTEISDVISCNSATEQNKLTEITSTDADPNDLEIGMVNCTEQKEKIITEYKKQESKKESISDYKIDTYNNSQYVDKNSTLTEEISNDIDCTDFENGIDYDIKISNYYTLGDLTINAVVSSYKLINQKGLTKEQIGCNIKTLSINVLDKIKERYSNMIVTSCFRHGNGKSQHYKGEAADLQFIGSNNSEYITIAEWIKNNVSYDQLLLEYKNKGTKKPWIHISYKKEINRNMDITLFNDSSRSPGGYGLIDLSGNNGIPV